MRANRGRGGPLLQTQLESLSEQHYGEMPSFVERRGLRLS